MHQKVFNLCLYRSTNNNNNSSDQGGLDEIKSRALTGLDKVLCRLRSAQASLKAETKANEELGRGVTVRVMQSAAPNECDKYKLHVEETDKITSLLLGLTARMARTDNAINAATDSSDEKVKTCHFSKVAVL